MRLIAVNMVLVDPRSTLSRDKRVGMVFRTQLAKRVLWLMVVAR